MKNPYNSMKIFHHSDILNRMIKDEVFAPIYVRLKPTNTCNHHCAYCSYGQGNVTRKTALRDSVNKKDMIGREKMHQIVEDMGDMGVKAVTFTGGGEPLTYPYILETVQGLSDKGIDIALISNGQLLQGDIAAAFYNAKWVRISFDSPRLEEYAKLRGIPCEFFQKVVKNIENFASKKNKNCVLGINYVVGRENGYRVYEAAKLVRELGVSNIKFSPVIDNTLGYHWEIKDEVIAQIKQAQQDLSDDAFTVIDDYESQWQDRNFTTPPFSHCHICRLVTVIGADEKIYFCQTKAYDSHYIVGSIKEQSFRETWFSKKTQERLRRLNPTVDCHNYCVFFKRNELIDAYMNINLDHINFI